MSPPAETRHDVSVPEVTAMPPVPSVPEELGSGDALKTTANCIQQRATGALCIDAPEGVRRILLRDGDVVTVASGIDGESLVGFLGARGDLSREAVSQLEGKIPAYGRHAGAALVAHGHISQDQLWPVLRAHAEWTLGQALLAERGTASFELEPPGRLKAEPSVFGGATGSEVLIDVVRRVVSSAIALARLGGAKMRVTQGPRWDLLPECALTDAEQSLLGRAKGSTLEQSLGTPGAEESAPLLYALAALGVIALDRMDNAPARAKPARSAPAFDPIDAQALRAQVTTRLSLIEEADYFTLLGVTRAATPYDIHRAYLELRRTFSPNRVLTAATADLADDLELILEVLEEAHDVLRDQTRRERYRRAIEGDPP
jgi:hypothetical protein